MQTIIVAGPPGSGKTTYVNQRRNWGDLVIDMDALFVAISGGLDWYEKPASLLPYALSARDAIIERLVRGDDELSRAWVITSEADPQKRGALARRLNGEVVVLAVPVNECLRRIAADPRRAERAEMWRPVVERWWEQYRSAPGEMSVEG